MESKELRIGNWVQEHHMGIPEQPNPPVQKQVSEEMFQTINHLVEPIPLTEEWLVKFGFFNSDSFDGLAIDVSSNLAYDYLAFDEESLFFIHNDGREIPLSYNKPNYVHQLQNLYFALTGEELTKPRTPRK